MDNLQYLGVQTQRVLQRRLQAAANNIANVSTAGFKAEGIVTEEIRPKPASVRELPHDVRYVRDLGLARNMAQGSITRTDNVFDVAIDGDGFFSVQGDDGPLYTRDGAFRLDGVGRLVTRDGRQVLNAGGAPIVFDPQGQPPVIDAQGRVRVGEAELAQLGVTVFANPAAMTKVGDNLWSAGAAAPAAFTGTVVQGALEQSNVNPMLELTRVMEISRAYESAARIVRGGDDLRQRAIERLGRAS